MLMAHPAVLNNLVDRYQTLNLLNREDPQDSRRLEAVSYTLCVATSTTSMPPCSPPACGCPAPA
ncbi:DUF5133 domain-containing protein [Streptomyces sp. NPDC001902]